MFGTRPRITQCAYTLNNYFHYSSRRYSIPNMSISVWVIFEQMLGKMLSSIQELGENLMQSLQFFSKPQYTRYNNFHLFLYSIWLQTIRQNVWYYFNEPLNLYPYISTSDYLVAFFLICPIIYTNKYILLLTRRFDCIQSPIVCKR